jgi:uncharacterized membrane protein YhaH (DUF805 family)
MAMEPSPIAQVAQLLPLTVAVALTLWMSVRILRKAGYSGWWSLLAVVPLLNIAMIWVFAMSDWPALKARN